MKRFFTFILLTFSYFIQVEATVYYFYVQLTDKNNTPYSFNNPLEYLSQKALDRRTFFNVSIDSLDLPVNPSYISQIKALNVNIHNQTKWLNGVTVEVTDSSVMSSVRNLSFVKFVQYTGKTDDSGQLVSKKKTIQIDSTLYGHAYNQINMLKGQILHENGFMGQGMQIAVIDGGFLDVNTNPGLDSVRLQNRLLGTKDFVNPQSNIYEENYHGANVLTFMAGNIPNQFLGTAPKASYWLLRSEAANSENLCEPDFWVSAVEFADSLGVDVTTTSLGYYTFDDSTMNYTYADMNGKTSRASIAATIAAEKGLLMMVAAGNEGNIAWHYIGAPADADKIIAVGAVSAEGDIASFSSFGPTSDGRIKPDLCAEGLYSSYVNIDGNINQGSGTSYATPILAGIATCFLQAAKEKNPNLSLDEIREMIIKTGSLYNAPTAQMGYGIPNFETAYYRLINSNSIIYQKNNLDDNIKVTVLSDKSIIVKIDEEIESSIIVNAYSISGQYIGNYTFNSNIFKIINLQKQNGIYILNLRYNNKSKHIKFIL